jgi:TonB family protein
MPQPFAAIARESLRTDPARRCSLGEIVGRLKAPPAQQQSSVPESTPATPAKIRLSWIVAPAVVAILLIAFFLMRSHRSEPSPDAAEQQSETAIAKPSPSSPAPEMRDSKPAAAPALANDAVVEQVLPDVSQKAAASIHGQFLVKVRVSVDATGAVSSADVDSQGPSKYFASLALEAARHWRFKPAQVNGEDVASAWTLQFRFTRSGTEVTPVRVSP